jgi:DNA-binding MurR/RpiR family transcriptional regulator
MVDPGPLQDRIVATFAELPPQLRTAARFVLDHPRDVALLSMREQAKRAQVKPATMTRLAKRLGLDGYDAVRGLYADSIRAERLDFSRRAGEQLADQRVQGDRALASRTAATLAHDIEALQSSAALDRIAEAAAALAAAGRVYCLGLRACHAVAWQLHYVLSLAGRPCELLDGAGGVGLDALRRAGDGDVLFAASIRPYTRATVGAAHYAHRRGVPIVAVTDSEVSPLARMARHVIVVSTASPSFFHSIAAGFAVAEILAAIVAGHAGEAALEALGAAETHFAALDVHWPAGDGGIHAEQEP